MHKKYGQIVIVLLLTMLVALAVGLTITQRSITDISTSTQTEQSTRALSAAEAGLEKALSQGTSFTKLDLGNQSNVDVKVSDSLPGVKQALENPSVGKEEIAQFWLASPVNFTQYYNQNQIDIYFGESPAAAVKPAVEITYVYKNTSTNEYALLKKFVDSDPASRSNNGFDPCTPPQPPDSIPTTSSANSTFLCKYTLIGLTTSGTPMLIRVRPLYATNQKIAVKPYDAGPGCTTGCSLPPQAALYTSIGTAGQSQKTLRLLKTKAIPFFFDYAVFSTGDITK